MKKFMKEFKDFALRGNVISLAVGMIIGLAFQGVITSLTDNILSPLIGLFIGKNFDALTWEFMGVTLGYGAFITAVLNFIILAFVVFLIVQGMNRVLVKSEQEERHCPYCKTIVPEDATRCPACTSVLG
ncbi:MAG: large conductance mechanosensitive channel protein MscL [Oscillospiraceae bacterium]|nr:large conductance mechanosensitive channel protein MscL [Oscillospiraceae bacterium]